MNNHVNNTPIKIKCLTINQPIGVFYITSIKWQDLLRISWADIRHLDSDSMEDYLGIQRELSPKRVEELKRYVTTVDATFPTGIILAIRSDDIISYDEDSGLMEIVDDEKVAKIIDGQHRIAGLEGLVGKKVEFDLNITLFVDMDIEDQAMVFATINLAQTKVRKSLAYDLYEYAKSRSPQKTSHNIAKLLNNKPDSPFFQRIKILGTAKGNNQLLTQAAFVEALIPLISGDLTQALEDRDQIKRGKSLRISNSNGEEPIFRKFFIDKDDAIIARIIWNYFSAVEARWRKAWNDTQSGGSVLPRTNGFRALMRFLPKIYKDVKFNEKIPSESAFLDIFNKVDLEDNDFNIDNFKPGSSGEKALLDNLLQGLNLDF